MAKIRFGYSDDFTAKNSGVGINTTDPQTNLDVDGVVKGQDLRVTGVSLQTGYEGFLRADHQIEEETQLNFGQGINASLSGEIIVGTGQTVTVTENLKEDRFGPELITNGQFLSNVDNWTANDSSNSLNNGRMRITRSGGNGRATYQIITSLVPGATYFASAIVDSIGSRGDFRVKKGSLWTNNAYLLTSGTNGQVKTLSGSFTATGTTALVGFAIDNDSTVIEVDQVTVRRVNDVEEPGTNVAGGSQIECMKVYDTFTPPSGGTNERPYKPKPGQLYYNYDLKTIEFHDGYGWRQVDNTTRAGRAYYFGGSHPGLPSTSQIEFVNVSTFGNSQYFGDLSIDMGRNAGCSSNVRGISAGGTPSGGDTIEYFTLSSSGSGVDFGNLLASQNRFDACSSSTRGVFTGGHEPAPSYTNVLQYIEIATTGNALDFGDLTIAKTFSGSCSSPTKGICAGGNISGGGTTVIDIFTIAAKGDAIDFGDLIQFNQEGSAASNSLRGVIAGGYGAPARHNVMQYITIASNGNAEYFGDLSIAKSGMSGTGNQTRAVYFGCTGASPANTTTIDSILYSTTGNSVDFGDFTYGGLNGNRAFAAATSDSHGGLGGF